MKKLNLLFIIALLAFNVSSCGSNLTEGSSELESRADIDPGENEEDVYDASGALQALCSPLKMSDANFDAQLELYFRNGIYIPDQILLRFKKVPTELGTGAQFINFFRQYEPDNGGLMTDTTPVEFVFVNKNNRNNIITLDSPITSLSKGILESIIEDNNLVNLGLTSQNFLNYYNIILKGLDIKYESLATSIYETSNPSTSFANQAALLPAYPADPNVYAQADNGSYLIGLHPMTHRKDSGLSEAQFKYEIEEACRAPF